MQAASRNADAELWLSIRRCPKGAVKPPVFLTSTFVFKSAEEGRDFFDYASGRKEPPSGTASGLVYSRFNHPNSEIVEDRLAIYERTDACILFSSGMSAIATTSARLSSARATSSCIRSRFTAARKRCSTKHAFRFRHFGAVGFADGVDEAIGAAAADAARAEGRVSVILIETPSNPTNSLVDIAMMRRDRRDRLEPAGSIADHRLRQHACSARSSSGRSNTAPISPSIR
jgi:methionine-gamma-lyase